MNDNRVVQYDLDECVFMYRGCLIDFAHGIGMLDSHSPYSYTEYQPRFPDGVWGDEYSTCKEAAEAIDAWYEKNGGVCNDGF